MKVLVINAGSSSQKTALYEIGEQLPERAPAAIWEGKLDSKDGKITLTAQRQGEQTRTLEIVAAGSTDAPAELLKMLNAGPAAAISERSEIGAIGHRIVNGGPEHTKPERVTVGLKRAIEAMCPLAPLHNRSGLDGIAMAEREFPGVPQVAVFDSGFHRHLPEAAAIYSGRFEWAEQGIRRYGFHGINHQYVAERAAQLAGKNLIAMRLVTCHLGNGCSLAAIRDGHSVDTTMGFTPLDGLMMGTRSGSLDPSIVTFLMRSNKISADQIDEILNKKSGLLGISGISGDMRHIVSAMKQNNARAKLAFDIFVHRLRAGIAAMAASLGRLDALVFTAGIGENSAEVRAAACAALEFMGVKIDDEKNASARPDCEITAPGFGIRVFVLRAEEDWAIAKECWQLVRSP